MSTYLIGGRLVAGGGLQAGQITLRRILTLSSTTELVLNDAESIDANLRLPLRDPDTGVVIDLPQQLVPGRDFIGIMSGDRLLAAGPMWADPFTFPYTSRVVAGGLWSYFDHRFVLPPLGEGQLPRDVTSIWASWSLRTIAKRLVQQACSHPGADLPIDYEDDIPGAHVREYPGSDGISVGDALRRLTEVEDGPDIAFRPYITADRRFVRWALVTGDPELSQAGADWYWDVSAPGPHAVMPALERDGRQLHSRRYLTGATVRNELRNAAFADGDDGWGIGVTASSWEIVEGGDPYHGTNYGRWVSAGSGDAFFGSRTTLNVEPDETITMFAAFRAQVDGRPMRTRIAFLDADGDVIEYRHSAWVSAPDAPDWVEHYQTETAPAGTVTAKFDLIGDPAAGGEAFACGGAMVIRTGEHLPFFPDDMELQAVADSEALTAAGFPLLEDWENRSTVLREETLQAYADEGVLRGSTHIETRTLKAKRYAHPALGTYQPGDYAKIRQAANARGPEQTVRERIIRVSFRAEGDVDIDLAPQRVVSGYPIPSSNRRWLSDQLAAIERRIAENKG